MCTVDDVRRDRCPILELLQDLLDLVAAVRQLRALLVDVLRRRQPLLELRRVRLDGGEESEGQMPRAKA
jgi:hypothetical protein